ncbi:MAG: 30S ribosomal protein S15 [Candidatus Absconditicoccaceae bacterium]
MVTKKKTTTTKASGKSTSKVSTDTLQRHGKDTGSPEVQVLTLSQEIESLQGHLVSHPKDVDAKRSLLKKVAKRRRLLKYLKEEDLSTYSQVSKKLNLKV